MIEGRLKVWGGIAVQLRWRPLKRERVHYQSISTDHPSHCTRLGWIQVEGVIYDISRPKVGPLSLGNKTAHHLWVLAKISSCVCTAQYPVHTHWGYCHACGRVRSLMCLENLWTTSQSLFSCRGWTEKIRWLILQMSWEYKTPLLWLQDGSTQGVGDIQRKKRIMPTSAWSTLNSSLKDSSRP